MRALEERQLIDSKRGRIAIGWLIVEDLVMVLTLVLLPAIAGIVDSNNASFNELAIKLTLPLVKSLFLSSLPFPRPTTHSMDASPYRGNGFP